MIQALLIFMPGGLALFIYLFIFLNAIQAILIFMPQVV